MLAERRWSKEGDTSGPLSSLRVGFQAALEAVSAPETPDGDYDRLHKMPCSLIISLISL